jgi:hypothetical protein
VGMSACSLVDQVREEKVPVAELVRLRRLDLVMLRGCIRRRIGVRRQWLHGLVLLRVRKGLANDVDGGCRTLGPGVVD